LLVFGLQWLRKAVLRASGNKALHDETAAFQATLAATQHTKAGSGRVVPDWYGFTLAFKGVVLEGLEVVFIALTFGTNQHNVALAGIGSGITRPHSRGRPIRPDPGGVVSTARISTKYSGQQHV
jgi:uncharacterized membrane protein